MGLGGAFVALADDATAAFANPAGLVQLVRPEVSIEGRYWRYSTPFTERGRVEGLPSGIGADTTVGLETARSEQDLADVAFVSVAYPAGRWCLALFRHQLARFEFESETRGLFGGGTDSFQERFFDQRVTTDLDFVSSGVAVAYRLSENLSLGVGAIYHDISLSSVAAVFLPDEDPVAGLLAPTSYLPERSLVSQSVGGQDGDWALTAGLLWRPSESWRVGGVYRQGPETAIAVETIAGRAVDFGVPPGGILRRVDDVPVELPAVLGLGVAYRAPDGSLTVSFQWDRIEYSTVVDSLERFAARTGEPANVAVDDAHEIHLGGEYVFLRSTPVVAVRLGAWLDPDHQLRDTSGDLFLEAIQPRGEDQLHATFGLGIAYQKFQFDLGIDLSDEMDTASMSAVYSF
jgi:long-subunit fatty acid transport protein